VTWTKSFCLVGVPTNHILCVLLLELWLSCRIALADIRPQSDVKCVIHAPQMPMSAATLSSLHRSFPFVVHITQVHACCASPVDNRCTLHLGSLCCSHFICARSNSSPREAATAATYGNSAKDYFLPRHPFSILNARVSRRTHVSRSSYHYNSIALTIDKSLLITEAHEIAQVSRTFKQPRQGQLTHFHRTSSVDARRGDKPRKTPTGS
jgi:hypothetical protein